MMISRTSARSVLLMLAITSSCVSFFAPAFGNSAKHSTTDGAAPSAELSPLMQNDADLRLVADTVASLRRIHTDSMDTEIPSVAKPLLVTLKHQLVDLTADLLRYEDRSASTLQLNARVIEDLRRSGVIVTEPVCTPVGADYVDAGFDYGEIYDITLKRPRSCLDLIAMTTEIGIPYGDDTSLYLFKYEAPEWKLIFADEINGYDSISLGQGDFEFGVSWPDANGSFFVVTASVNAWPTSNWQAITYRMLRQGPSPYEPRELLRRKETIWLGDEPPYRLEVTYNGFTLRFHDEKYLDLLNQGEEVSIDDPKGMRIINYSVDGDQVKKKQLKWPS